MTDLKRRYEMKLTMGADSLQDMQTMLNTLIFDLARIDSGDIEVTHPYQQVSGGYSGNHHMSLEIRPEVTHDSYFEQLEAHLDAKKGGVPDA